MPNALPLGRFTVTYASGETVEVQSNFYGVMEIERAYPEPDAPFGTVLAFGIWTYLGCPDESLNEWAKTVTMIEPKADEKAETPTRPVVGVA